MEQRSLIALSWNQYHLHRENSILEYHLKDHNGHHNKFYGNRGYKAGCILKSLNARSQEERQNENRTFRPTKSCIWMLSIELFSPLVSVLLTNLPLQPALVSEILLLRNWAVSVFSELFLVDGIFRIWVSSSEKWLFFLHCEQAVNLSWMRVKDTSAS